MLKHTGTVTVVDGVALVGVVVAGDVAQGGRVLLQ
jgi:hypothetical protein